MARWLDGGFCGHLLDSYKCDSLEELPRDFQGLGKRSDYLRTTFDVNDPLKRDPYEVGHTFFKFIKGKMGDDFFHFLKHFHETYRHRLYTQDMFFQELDTFSKDRGHTIEINGQPLLEYVADHF